MDVVTKYQAEQNLTTIIPLAVIISAINAHGNVFTGTEEELIPHLTNFEGVDQADQDEIYHQLITAHFGISAETEDIDLYKHILEIIEGGQLDKMKGMPCSFDVLRQIHSNDPMKVKLLETIKAIVAANSINYGPGIGTYETKNGMECVVFEVPNTNPPVHELHITQFIYSFNREAGIDALKDTIQRMES